MGMLDRIKRKQNEGFKEFVISMETTSATGRGQIFTAGVLEDPIFMSHVMKNIRTFDDFLKLDSDEIETVLLHQDQLLSLFAKAIFGASKDFLAGVESAIPHLTSRLKDELSYLGEVSAHERDSARFYLLKTVRKLQMEDKILGFRWLLPPQTVYHASKVKDGAYVIFFENGSVAASGLHLKGRRVGEWKHYYENGKELAIGDYSEGMKMGLWKFYYSDGKLKSEGEYIADERHGSWKEFDRSGNESLVQYSGGVKKTN
jgi:hypothetical protein